LSQKRLNVGTTINSSHAAITEAKIRRRKRHLPALDPSRLDPSAPEERIDAFAHFCLHDLADFRGWCERVRNQATHLYPADVRLVDDQEELRANLPGAAVAVIEELTFGANEIAAAGRVAQVRPEVRFHHA
jgi:hypothetical protein